MKGVYKPKDTPISEEEIQHLGICLETVLLEEWGGPRSPLALEYFKNTIIPGLLHCFRNNLDLLTNPTFREIMGWKLQNEFAYPHMFAGDLARDLVQAAQKLIGRAQNNDPKEPWWRVFRLWVSGESLILIRERTGYPLDYLELLLIRWKKLNSFLSSHRVSLLECMESSELREFGLEQLGFLYQFQMSLSSEPLFKERLALEQVLIDFHLPFQVAELVTLLEIVHTHEGTISETELISALLKTVSPLNFSANLDGEAGPTSLVRSIQRLIKGHFIQMNKAGKLTLCEKSAQALSGFLIPKLSEQLQKALRQEDLERARQILLGLNPEVLHRMIDWIALNLTEQQVLILFQDIYKKVNRKTDLYLIQTLSRFEGAAEFLILSLGEQDSLIRAKACEALGRIKYKEATFRLIQLLRDPVDGVREMAAFALGELGSTASLKELARVSDDLGEPIRVREQANEAMVKIEKRSRTRLGAL